MTAGKPSEALVGEIMPAEPGDEVARRAGEAMARDLVELAVLNAELGLPTFCADDVRAASPQQELLDALGALGAWGRR